MSVESGTTALGSNNFLIMSSSSTQILHKDRVPGDGALVIPGRLDFEQLLMLEKFFAGRRITWLVEEFSEHDSSMRGYLEKSGSGAMFAAAEAAPAVVGAQMKSYLKDGGLLIYVPGRMAVRNASASHVPGSHLRTMCAFGLPVLPIAIDCPRESCLSIERRSSLPSSVIVIGKPVPAAVASAAAWHQSLLEAHQEAYSSRALFKTSLAMALL